MGSRDPSLPLSRGCPGILSYHISHQAVERVTAGGLEGLWDREPVEGEGEEMKNLSATAVAEALLVAIEEVCRLWAESLPPLTQVPGSIELSLHAIKNNRRKMEDRQAVCVDINSLFGLKVCVWCGIRYRVSVYVVREIYNPPPGLPPSVILCSI